MIPQRKTHRNGGDITPWRYDVWTRYHTAKEKRDKALADLVEAEKDLDEANEELHQQFLLAREAAIIDNETSLASWCAEMWRRLNEPGYVPNPEFDSYFGCVVVDCRWCNTNHVCEKQKTRELVRPTTPIWVPCAQYEKRT